MELRYTKKEHAFRKEVRDFFQSTLPADIHRKQMLGQRLTKNDYVT